MEPTESEGGTHMARFHTDTQTDTSAFAPKSRDWLIVDIDQPNLAWGAVMVIRGATGGDVRAIIAPEAWGAVRLDDVSVYDLGELMTHPRLTETDRAFLKAERERRVA